MKEPEPANWHGTEGHLRRAINWPSKCWEGHRLGRKMVVLVGLMAVTTYVASELNQELEHSSEQAAHEQAICRDVKAWTRHHDAPRAVGNFVLEASARYYHSPYAYSGAYYGITDFSSNMAGAVNYGQKIPVHDPLWFRARDGRDWIGFTIDTAPKSDPNNGSVCADIDWAQYSGSSPNSKSHQLVRAVSRFSVKRDGIISADGAIVDPNAQRIAYGTIESTR